MASGRELKFKVSQEGAEKTASDIAKIEQPVNSLKDRFTSLTDASLKVGGALTAMGAAGTAAIYSLVTAAAEAEAGQKMLEHAVIDVSHGTQEQVQALQDLAAQIMANGVLDDDAIIRGQAQLSTFGLQTESVMELTQSMADLAVNQYGVTAGGAELEASANMIAKALQGEFGMLEKSGIRFTEAQKQMILYGTEAEKVAAIQEGFNQNLKYTNEVAAQTFEGAMANLQNQFGSFQETLGAAMIPALMELGEILAKVAEWLNSLDEGTVEVIAKVLLFGTAAAAIVGPILIVIGLLPSLIAGFTALGTIIAFLTSPILLVAAAIVALAILIYTQWDSIKAYTVAVWEGIKDAMNSVWEWAKEAFYNFIVTLLALIALIFPPFLIVLQLIRDHWDEMVTALKEALSTLVEFFTEVWTTIKDAAILVFNIIADSFMMALENMKNTLIAILDAFLSLFGTSTDEILALWDSLWASFSGVITGYAGGIKNVISSLMTFLSEKVTAIINAVQDAWNYVKGLASGATDAILGASAAGDAAGSSYTPAAFATGGIVTGPTMALIGEGGMNEAVVPLPDGRSIPVEVRGSQSGTSTVILHQGDVIINNTQDVDSYFQTMKKRFIEELQMSKLGSITV